MELLPDELLEKNVLSKLGHLIHQLVQSLHAILLQLLDQFLVEADHVFELWLLIPSQSVLLGKDNSDLVSFQRFPEEDQRD